MVQVRDMLKVIPNVGANSRKYASQTGRVVKVGSYGPYFYADVTLESGITVKLTELMFRNVGSSRRLRAKDWWLPNPRDFDSYPEDVTD